MTRMFFCALSRSCSHGSVSRAFCGLPANHANKREKKFRKQESVFSVDIYSRQFACLAGSVAVAPAPSSSEGRFTLAKQRERASAFTLAELLIATGVTAGIVLMLGWMLGALMGTASHANARVDAFRDARAALQMIERDLRNLVRTQWSPDPFTSPAPSPCTTPTVSTTAVTRPAAYFALDPTIYADPATTGNQNQQLYALIADRTSGSPGDVCAVGYYCRWDDQLHAYSLRRFFHDSATTFAAIQGASGYAGDSVLYTPASSDAVLAAYVWNLTITLYDAAGNRYTPVGNQCICDFSATSPRQLPAAIEISFNAMSPQAARTVMSVSSAPNDWMDTTTQNYQRLISPHAYQFRSRINLP
jgi:type II secretory pathway pseudopilin PulG